MESSTLKRRTPDRRELVADAVIHIIGVALVLLALGASRMWGSGLRDEAAVIAAISIYGVTLILMIVSSASHNLVSPRLTGRAPEWLRRIDHSAIYVKIAGTYTPFAVIAGGSVGRWLLIGVWSGAALGFLGKVLAPDKWERASIVLYLAMGWLFVFAAGPISAAISTATLVLILVGGGLYTVGVLFHLWHRLPYQNAIWHVFVLVASFVFYSAMMVEVAIGV